MEKVKSTEIELGFNGVFALDIVPQLELTLNAPEAKTVKEIGQPQHLHIQFPIAAQHKNIKQGQLCKLSWLVNREDAGTVEARSQIPCMINVDDPQNCRITGLKGETLVLDILDDGLIGKGKLGFRIDIDFPHAEPVEFEPAIAFSNIIDLDMKKSGSVLIGSQISFTPKYNSVFNHASIALEISEKDEGEGEVENTDGYVVTHQWEDGDKDAWHWRLGFTDENGSKLAYMEPQEFNDFEYLVQLKVSADEWKTFHTVYRNDSLLVGIKKPKLSQFVYEPYYIENLVSFISAYGKITNIDASVGYAVEIALGHYNSKLNTIENFDTLKWQAVSLNKDGFFSTPLDIKIFGSAEIPDGNFVAILRIPSSSLLYVSEEGYRINEALDYDESLNAGIQGGKVADKSSATCIRSELKARKLTI